MNSILKEIEELRKDCWICPDSIPDKYRSVYIRGSGRAHSIVKSVHVVAYEMFFGSVPDGKIVCHKCNNKPCFNPDHLYADTQSGNIEYAIRCGNWKRDQRYGRTSTFLRELPKGICWDASRNKYKVCIRVGNKRPSARFSTLAEAIKGRVEMELKYWGERKS